MNINESNPNINEQEDLISKDSKQRLPAVESLGKEWRNDLYQMAEWRPRHPLAFGHANTLNEVIDSVLITRGYTREDEAILSNYEVPTILEAGIDEIELEKFENSLIEGAKQNERVLTFSDNDVDGMTANIGAALLCKAFGITSVNTAAPDRFKYGFGFNKKYAELYGGKYDHIIILDCGITSKEAIDLAIAKGTKVTVVDHHSIQEGKYPDQATNLHTEETSTSGILNLMWRHFHTKYGNDFKPPHGLLELLTMALKADYESMDGVNYPLVRDAIQNLQKDPPFWLQLFQAYEGFSLETVSDEELDYPVSAVLNNSGRFGSNDTLRFYQALFGNQPKSELRLIFERIRRNFEGRKALMPELRKELDDAYPTMKDDKYFLHIFNRPEMGKGLISPLSSVARVATNKPTFIGTRFKYAEDAEVQDPLVALEARTPFGAIDFMPLIEKLQPFLVDGGGHPNAAGFTFKQSNETQVLEIIQSHINTVVPEIADPTLDVDCELEFNAIPKILNWQDEHRPFGPRFDLPTFLTQNVQVIGMKVQRGNTTKFTLEKDGHRYTAILFTASEKQLQVQIGDEIDVLYSIGKNSWNGKTTTQLKMLDFREPQQQDIRQMPHIPKRSEVPPPQFESSEIDVPSELEENFKKALSDTWLLDRDDIIVHSNPSATKIDVMSTIAYGLTGDPHFRVVPSTIEVGTAQWNEYHAKINELSRTVFGNQELIQSSAQAHSTAFRTNEERAAIFLNLLGSHLDITTSEKFWDWYKEKFIKGNPFYKFRLDKFTLVDPDIVSLINYGRNEYGTKNIINISNSDAAKVAFSEQLLLEAGMQKKLTYKRSAESMKHTKPDPYSLQLFIENNLNEMNKKGKKDGILYIANIGNSLEDMQFGSNALDLEAFPFPKSFDTNRVVIVPVLITHGADYSDLSLPPHIEAATLKDIEKYMRSSSMQPKP